METVNLPYDGPVTVYDFREGAKLIEDYVNRSAYSTKNSHGQKRSYANIVASFDIETSKVENLNRHEDDPECYHYFSYPFCWQFMLEDKFVFGRSIEDFFRMLQLASADHYLIIYIHNITFEYNNLADYFRGADIFFKNGATPLYIRYLNRYEFRCSAQLTHKSLAAIGDDIGYQKLLGDFDYSILRGVNTPLTEEELNYCYRDVAIINKYIRKQATAYTVKGHPSALPYTQTGYVRKDVKGNFSNTPLGLRILNRTELTFPEFNLVSKGFFGGFTHHNFRECCKEIEDFLHYDITSAYPWVLVTQRMPYKLNRDPFCNIDLYLERLQDENIAQIAQLHFHGLRLKPGRIPYAPVSMGKCVAQGTKIEENGRYIYVEDYIATFCDIDARLILDNYEYDYIDLLDLMLGVKRPLPRPLVRVIIQYFNNKTKLKGVTGVTQEETEKIEYEYYLSKTLLNGIYGLSAQSLVHYSYSVNDDLTIKHGDLEYTPADTIPYQVAIYCTAYVRQVIYGIAAEICKFTKKGEDPLYIYSDTDSIFCRNDPRVVNLIDNYNEEIKKQIDELESIYPNIKPANPKGEVQYLGLLLQENDDGVAFCTIGAKRYYITHPDGTVDLTVSGLRATKTWKDKDGVRHNGYNTQRLIDMYGSIHNAFLAIYNKEDVTLPYIPGVDKLSSYNMRADFRGEIEGEEVTRPCSYLLYPVDTSLNINKTITDAILWIGKGMYVDIYGETEFY